MSSGGIPIICCVFFFVMCVKCFWKLKCKFHPNGEISTLLIQKSVFYANYLMFSCVQSGAWKAKAKSHAIIRMHAQCTRTHTDTLTYSTVFAPTVHNAYTRERCESVWNFTLTGIHQCRPFGCLLKIVRIQRCDHRPLRRRFASHP